MEEKDWPAFLKKYPEHIRIEVYSEFVAIAIDYKKNIAAIKENGIRQDIAYTDYNKLFNANKKHDTQAHLDHYTNDCIKKAKDVVKAKGLHAPEKKLTKHEKYDLAKENGNEIAPEKQKNQPKELSDKEKLNEKAFDFAETRVDIIKREEERAKFIAELKATKELNQSLQKEKER